MPARNWLVALVVMAEFRDCLGKIKAVDSNPFLSSNA